MLAGTVLDEATLTAVTHHLSTQFPTITFDTSGVQTLRQAQPKLLTVSTNLAGVHRQPSRMTERVSEVFNGVVLEQLMEQNGWVFVRQMDGYLGWVYRRYVTESPPPPPTRSSPPYSCPCPAASRPATPGGTTWSRTSGGRAGSIASSSTRGASTRSTNEASRLPIWAATRWRADGRATPCRYR